MIRTWRLLVLRRFFSRGRYPSAPQKPSALKHESNITAPQSSRPTPSTYRPSIRAVLASLPRSVSGWLRLGTTLAGNFAWLSFKYGVFAHVIWTHGCYVVLPRGASMLPTMHVDGEMVVVDARCRRGRGVRVGDVVSAANPLGEEFGVIKRVVGLPGDFVLAGTPERSDAMLQVPAGHCFLAGDNQNFSRDSRYYGPIPLALVQGKVIFRLLPLSRMGWIRNSMRSVEEEEMMASAVT